MLLIICIHQSTQNFGDKKKNISDSERSLISETVSIDGTVNSSGAIDIAGLVKGPVFSKELVIKETGSVSTPTISEYKYYILFQLTPNVQNFTGFRIKL